MSKALCSVRCGVLWCLLFVAVLSSATLPAQGSAGRIEGTVRDQQTGVLPGVIMTLRNQSTGVTHTLTTEGDGRYVFPALAPGRYTMRAALSGFAGHEIVDIPITIGLELRRDITLQVQTLVMLRYPREGHGMRETQHVADFLERSISWYEKHFQGAARATN